MNLLGLDVIVGTSAKLTAAYTVYTRTKEHSYHKEILQGKFPCKRKFWYLQGKMQGNKIDKEIARKSSLKQGN
jgi:hypothetical protein